VFELGNFTLVQMLAMGLLWMLFFSFVLQIWSAVTPPNPNIISSLVLGTVIASVGIYLLYTFLPLSISLLSASMSGVYDAQGVFYALGILALDLAFTVNVVLCWGQNRPVDIFQ
jgi:hypothetical protein